MIVLLGATGQLGTAFRALLGDRVQPLGRQDIDLRRPETIRPTLHRLEPVTVVNCAAYTAVDAAESDEATATLVNGESVGELAEVCAELDARLVTFSTDYVFDGTKPDAYLESDEVCPINAYGRSKAVGERAALAANARSLVVRTSWVISRTHPNFVHTMLRLGREGHELRVVDDQTGRATIADDLARASWSALESGVTGLLHLSNPGVVTWYELARRTFELAGLDLRTLSPCTTANFPRPAPRPARSVLGSERLTSLGLADLPPLDEGLPELVEDLMRLLDQSSNSDDR